VKKGSHHGSLFFFPRLNLCGGFTSEYERLALILMVLRLGRGLATDGDPVTTDTPRKDVSFGLQTSSQCAIPQLILIEFATHGELRNSYRFIENPIL
jgi:hypothetical protein